MTGKALVDEWLRRHRLADGDYYYGGEWAICANELAALLATQDELKQKLLTWARAIEGPPSTYDGRALAVEMRAEAAAEGK